MFFQKKVFQKLEESKFCRGDNKNGWKASFDWIFENEKNWKFEIVNDIVRDIDSKEIVIEYEKVLKNAKDKTYQRGEQKGDEGVETVLNKAEEKIKNIFKKKDKKTADWLSGTPPRKTRLSVPRLTADHSVRTSTSSGPGRGTTTGRISPVARSNW